MKLLKIGRVVFLLWAIYFISYNTYFGWNVEPINEIEKKFDVVSNILWYLSMFFYFLPILTLYEKAVEKLD